MLKKLSLILLGLVLGSQMALTQVTTATISGVVQDSTGAVIPGVTASRQLSAHAPSHHRSLPARRNQCRHCPDPPERCLRDQAR